MKFKRIFLIVLDSLGIGEARDVDKFGDNGANTLLNILQHYSIPLSNIRKMGLLNLVHKSDEKTIGYYTKAFPASQGKDSLTGHLEMMGIKTEVPYQTYPKGFPKELIQAIELESGHNIIGNCAGSGAGILKQFGEEHMKTGSLIVYTSADSALQIAAHESIVPAKELYRICENLQATVLEGDYRIARIIARPFAGNPGSFKRTPNRRDFTLKPKWPTVLDSLKDNGYEVMAIGKISDIFCDRGITRKMRTVSNLDGIQKTVITMNVNFTGLCFTNLSDFDGKYGHRRDVHGYAKSLSEFDHYLPFIIKNLHANDLLIITADHGNDPTYVGNDHTRENVPVLLYSKKFQQSGELPYLQTFADIGATIADNFGTAIPEIGTSLLEKLK